MTDRLGQVLFISTYVAMLSQIVGVLLTWDDQHDSYLFYNKIFFLTITILAIWSHIKATFTNPGRITHDINSAVLEFYLTVHDIPMRRAESINKGGYGKMLFEKMDENEDDKKDEDDDRSEYDEHEYEPVSSVADDTLERINKEYKVEFKRCNKCYVVRTPRVHHCSRCQSCVMKMDHHCPWINNCVGQFNQKFFLQFCYYCLIGCSNAAYITLYYLIYKHKKEYLLSF